MTQSRLVQKKYKDRQCSYNVILKRFQVTTVAVEKQQALLVYARVCATVNARARARGLEHVRKYM